MELNDAYKNLFTAYSDVLNVSEVAKMLGIGKPAVYNLIHEGKLKTIPCGRRFRVAKITVIEYLLSSLRTVA